MNKVKILGSGISAINLNKAVEHICCLIDSSKHHYVCISNVHTVVMGKKSDNYRMITNNAALALPDGIPLVWAGKLSGIGGMGRCSGPDLMVQILELSVTKGYTHYFYGSSANTLAKLNSEFMQKYPGLKIAGMYSPPFRPLTKEEDERITEEISFLKPDIVWVGLGAPKQEIWMAEHLGKINASVLIGVGAAFDFHAGVIKRAPVWMQKYGLEWFFRLVQEPGRLWKRYLAANTLFIIYIFADIIKLMFTGRGGFIWKDMR